MRVQFTVVIYRRIYLVKSSIPHKAVKFIGNGSGVKVYDSPYYRKSVVTKLPTGAKIADLVNTMCKGLESKGFTCKVIVLSGRVNRAKTTVYNSGVQKYCNIREKV